MTLADMVAGNPWRWHQAHVQMNAVELSALAKELQAAIRHPSTQHMLGWQAAAAQRLSIVHAEQGRRFRAVWMHEDNHGLSELLEKISAVGL